MSNGKREAERVNWGCREALSSLSPSPSDILPSARPHLLHIPDRATNWGRSVETFEPVGDIVIHTITKSYRGRESTDVPGKPCYLEFRCNQEASYGLAYS